MATDQEILTFDLDTLYDSIRVDWANLASKHLTAEQRKEIKRRLAVCIDALKDFLGRLERLPEG
jgi:hypothetical protein